MNFVPGDRVHLAGLGTGTIREARGSGRLPSRSKAASSSPLLRTSRRRSRPPSGARAQAPSRARPPGRGPALDLHGKTVVEALAAVEAFLNDMLIEGHGEVRVIHGRSGGRVKSAVHQYLRRLPVVASLGSSRTTRGSPS